MSERVQLVYDLMPVTERKIDANGYLEAPARLSRMGVQKYRARELRGQDGQQIFSDKGPDDFVFIHRPEAEVLADESVASFENLPITDGHPDPMRYPNGVTPATYKELAVGHVRDCRAGKDGYLHGRVFIRDEKAVQAVMSGKSQLSCGYGFDCEKKPGIAPDGQAYDGVMRNIRGNHLAAVYVARGGAGCSVADQQTSEEIMEKVKITVDGVEHQVEASAAPLVQMLVGKVTTLTQAATAKDAAHGEAVTKLAQDHAKELAALRDSTIPKTQVAGLVAKQCALLADCAAHCPTLKVEGLDSTALRRAMIGELVGKSASVKAVSEAVLAGVALDKATDEQVETVCNAVLASVKGVAADSAERRNTIAHAMSHPGGSAPRTPANGEPTQDGDIQPEDLSDGSWNRRFHSKNSAGRTAG